MDGSGRVHVSRSGGGAGYPDDGRHESYIDEYGNQVERYTYGSGGSSGYYESRTHNSGGQSSHSITSFGGVGVNGLVNINSYDSGYGHGSGHSSHHINDDYYDDYDSDGFR